MLNATNQQEADEETFAWPIFKDQLKFTPRSDFVRFVCTLSIDAYLTKPPAAFILSHHFACINFNTAFTFIFQQLGFHDRSLELPAFPVVKSS